jgi:tetratricopeptide (TPR) repeat protein
MKLTDAQTIELSAGTATTPTSLVTRPCWCCCAADDGRLEAAGRLGEAVPLFERTLADYERVYGTDHPNTLNLRNNLGYAYQAAGRLGEAVPLFERTLADYERVLGTDHPVTRTVRENLARARRLTR